LAEILVNARLTPPGAKVLKRLKFIRGLEFGRARCRRD
jgi:hypothetical protein